MLKVLNLYAGLGGNRKLWKDVEVTSVELNPKIAEVYRRLYPRDKLVIGDAHAYLIEHFREFDFIWSSPPCQTHSSFNNSQPQRVYRYPDMALYQEVLLLRGFFKGDWVVENVKPWYKPLIGPTFVLGRHIFWSNRRVNVKEIPAPKDGFIKLGNQEGREKLQKWLGIHFKEMLNTKNRDCQILRNCVHPLIGKQILDYFRQRRQVDRDLCTDFKSTRAD